MDTKSKIIEAQKRIIDALVDCETQVGELYRMYAERFPLTGKYWEGLAAAEKTHANLLKTMHRILDKGNVFFNLGKFDTAALQPVVTLIREAQERARGPVLTAEEANSTALKIETSILDSHFYDVVTSDAPEFKIIADRLSEDTRKHVDHIRLTFQTSIKG